MGSPLRCIDLKLWFLGSGWRNVVFPLLPLYGMSFEPGRAWRAGQGCLPGSPERRGLLTPGHSAALISHFLCSSCLKPCLNLLCRLSPCSNKAVAFPHSPSHLQWDRAHSARRLQTGGSSVLGSWLSPGAVPGDTPGRVLSPTQPRAQEELGSTVSSGQPGIPLPPHVTTTSCPVQSWGLSASAASLP